MGSFRPCCKCMSYLVEAWFPGALIVYSVGQEEKRMKEELKLTLDKLRRKALSEQNRAALRKQKQVSLNHRCCPATICLSRLRSKTN